MSETLEHEIRAALDERAANLSPHVIERLGRIDYKRQLRRRAPWLGSQRMLGAAGAVLAAGIIAAVVLLSSSAPAAYAGWTPTPTTPTPAAVAAATAACDQLGARLTGQPVLTDARGRYTALIYVSRDGVFDCISDGHSGDGSTSVGFSSNLGLGAAPGPNQLGLPSAFGGSAPGFPQSAHPNQSLPPQFQMLVQHVRNARLKATFEAHLRRMIDSRQERHLFGLTGSHVTAVSFILANGATVNATVQHHWYFAWWPGLDYPTSVRITTRSGATIASPMPSSGCRPGKHCSVFAGSRFQR